MSMVKRNGRQIGNLLARSLGQGFVGGSNRCTGSVCESFQALGARLIDRNFLRLFEMPRSPDRKSRVAEEAKNRESPRPEANGATGPPRVSEDRFVLRKTLVRDKKTLGSEDFSSKFARKFVDEDVHEVRAGPRPPTIPPPHPGGPCPPPPPDSSSGCGYCPPCSPTRDVCPPASPPGNGDPKPKYPPCPDRPKSKDSGKCSSNRQSSSNSERALDDPCGPAKCTDDGDPKFKCPPYPDRSNSKDSGKRRSNCPSPCGSERVPNEPCTPSKCPGGRDQKPKYPPCPDQPKSKDSGKCPSTGPSPCVSERVSDKPYAPVKCPEDTGRKKCSSGSSIKENPICGRDGFPVKPMNRGYSCSSRSDKRDSEEKASRCGSKTGEAGNAKNRDGANEKLESYPDGRVICVKPGQRKKRGNSSGKSCGKKSAFSDDSKSSRRSFSSGWSFVRMISNQDEVRGKILSTKRPKPGPACGKKSEPKECEGTKTRTGKGYRRKMISFECDDNRDGGKSSKKEDGREKFDPCGKGKSS